MNREQRLKIAAAYQETEATIARMDEQILTLSIAIGSALQKMDSQSEAAKILMTGMTEAFQGKVPHEDQRGN